MIYHLQLFTREISFPVNTGPGFRWNLVPALFAQAAESRKKGKIVANWAC